MKRIKQTSIIFLFAFAIIVAACGTSKKTTATATPPAIQPSAPTNPPLPSTNNFLFITPKNDEVVAPGDAELSAIVMRYKDVTLDQLNEGYTLYTQGACINCHAAKSIYNRGEEQWYHIIENMAPMAKITDAQKDAVYKYVLSIKATQPK